MKSNNKTTINTKHTMLQNITKAYVGLQPKPVSFHRNPTILNILIKMKNKSSIKRFF